jgi:hypothetical protein
MRICMERCTFSGHWRQCGQALQMPDFWDPAFFHVVWLLLSTRFLTACFPELFQFLASTRFIVQSQVQIHQKLVYFSTIHQWQQSITVTSSFLDIGQQCIDLPHFRNCWSHFSVPFTWKVCVRGRRNSDRVVVGKIARRHVEDLDIDGGY